MPALPKTLAFPIPKGFLTLGLLIFLLAAGPPQKKKKAEPLPPLNAGVVEFARSSLGKCVGDGVCTTLATQALESAGARRFPFSGRGGDYVWGDPVAEFKDVLPGDILQFRDAVFKGKRPLPRNGIQTWHFEYPHHTAIVAKVEQGGKLVTVLHQNVAFEGRPEGDKEKVQEDLLRMDSLQKGGWVKAYRPVPADRPAGEEGR